MSQIRERLQQYKEEYGKYAEFDGVYASDVIDMINQLISDLEESEKKNAWMPLPKRYEEECEDYEQ